MLFVCRDSREIKMSVRVRCMPHEKCNFHGALPEKPFFLKRLRIVQLANHAQGLGKVIEI